jgi:hypothetical protein
MAPVCLAQEEVLALRGCNNNLATHIIAIVGPEGVNLFPSRTKLPEAKEVGPVANNCSNDFFPVANLTQRVPQSTAIQILIQPALGNLNCPVSSSISVIFGEPAQQTRFPFPQSGSCSIKTICCRKCNATDTAQNVVHRMQQAPCRDLPFHWWSLS